MKKILIYRDSGASPLGAEALARELRREGLGVAYALGWADRHLFHQRGWHHDVQLLIFPGGRDLLYLKALRGFANRQIIDFVSGGGAFLGICAGGYYGSAQIEFEKDGPLAVCGDRELKFFPGIARGPAYGLGEFCYESERGARIANLRRCDDWPAGAVAYYNGGCAFVEADSHPSVSVLARYADIDQEPAAIVNCTVGTGQAILSGVHPEYRIDQAIDKQRNNLFRMLLDQLGLFKQND